MSDLKKRVDRVVRKTHVLVTKDDWKVLADYYLERLTNDGVNPETHRAEANELIESLRTIDPITERSNYKSTVKDFAEGNEMGFIAYLYFLMKEQADRPIRIEWQERTTIEGVLKRIREVREYKRESKL